MTATSTPATPADRCLSVALELVAAGYALLPVVLELKPDGDKRCTFPHDGTGARLRSSTDPDQIRAWWVDDPSRSFAVDVHASGVEVVDLDVGPGGDPVGERSWGDRPRGAMSVRTRSGGWQFYFRRRPDGVALGNSAGRLAKVDTRGAVNDMAFAPGAWLVNAPEQVYTAAGAIVSAAHLSPVPDAVIAAVGIPLDKRPGVVAAADDPFGTPSAHTGVFTPDQALTYCRHVIARLAACAPDGKYTALIAAARSLGKFEPMGVKEWLWERCAEALSASTTPVKDWTHARRGFDDSWANAVKAGDVARVVDATSNPFEAVQVSATDTPIDTSDIYPDLSQWLDEEYEPPRPEVGLERDDGVRLLYAGKWHTVIAEAGIGKSWLALWHCVEEMRRGNHVVYAHFEESSPRPTLNRLKALGVSAADIRERFHWLDATSRPSSARLGGAASWGAPSLVVLDGINAACGLLGVSPLDVEGVNAYRGRFVAPYTAQGAAVLSLGHPPKSRARQEERHSYGSTAWLDLVDGAAFRLKPSTRPIGRSRDGYVTVYVVKDREGGVEELGAAETTSEEGAWTYLGAFHLMPPQSALGNSWGRMSSPHKPEGDLVDDGEAVSAEVEAFRYLIGQDVSAGATVNAVRQALRRNPDLRLKTGGAAVDRRFVDRYGQWRTAAGDDWHNDLRSRSLCHPTDTLTRTDTIDLGFDPFG